MVRAWRDLLQIHSRNNSENPFSPVGWAQLYRAHRLSFSNLISIPFSDCVAPMFRVNTRFHITMKSGIRPVKNSLDVPIFYRIVMNVIRICLVCILTADLVFPESSLPDSRLSMLEFRIIHPSLTWNKALVRFGKPDLMRPQRKEKSELPFGNVHIQ